MMCYLASILIRRANHNPNGTVVAAKEFDPQSRVGRLQRFEICVRHPRFRRCRFSTLYRRFS